MRILVVDDDLTVRIVLEEILSSFGPVHCSADGNEAVQACTEALDSGNPYDLICLDLLMPTMNGLEALRIIRREEQNHGLFRPHAAKVMIITADDTEDKARQAFQDLCDAYLVKPIDAAALLDLVYCLCPVEECESTAGVPPSLVP